MSYFTDYRDHAGSNPEKFFKATLFQSPRILLGWNCLEPKQAQAVHTHDDQDKFYFVVEGEGEFKVGEGSTAQDRESPSGCLRVRSMGLRTGGLSGWCS